MMWKQSISLGCLSLCGWLSVCLSLCGWLSVCLCVGGCLSVSVWLSVCRGESDIPSHSSPCPSAVCAPPSEKRCSPWAWVLAPETQSRDSSAKRSQPPSSLLQAIHTFITHRHTKKMSKSKNCQKMTFPFIQNSPLNLVDSLRVPQLSSLFLTAVTLHLLCFWTVC